MTPTRRDVLHSIAASAVGLLPRDVDEPQKRPNILVMLADDMGYSDIGAYGSEIETPHLDRLASGGVRWSQFYNCARCCPSRACLLTGLYPHQAGVGHMVDKAGPAPGYVDDLSHSSPTIAEVLKTAGYRTGMFGKWHVTPLKGSKENWPLQRGFDQYFGIIHGAADYFNPVSLTDGNTTVEPDRPDFYLTDALGDRASAFVRDSAQGAKPWFLYVPFTAPHWPLHAPPDAIAKYKGRYTIGWDALREERHARQLASGLLDRKWNLSGRDQNAPSWANAPDKTWQAMRMAVYAAMVDRLDQNIGKILEALKSSGHEENTLILFMSDNGGCAEEAGPRWKGPHISKHTRSGAPVRVGNIPTVTPGAEDTFQSYGLPWANASNTPFRLYKHWVHEGGIATPLLMRWPNAIPSTKKAIAEPAHFIDVMATCCDVAKAKFPAQMNGKQTRPPQGLSLAPLAMQKGTRLDRTLYWEHEGNRAARQGDWKLVSKFPGKFELYDMVADRTELHDRSQDQPKITGKLAASWERWAKDSGVLPWDEVERQLVSR